VVLPKYATALLQVAIVVITAITAVLDKPVTYGVLIQLALLVIGAVGAYLVPLATIRWQGVWKTGSGVVIAALTAIVPLLTQGHLTAQNWLVVVLAGLSALASEVGVVIRRDAIPISAGVAAPDVTNSITSLPEEDVAPPAALVGTGGLNVSPSAEDV